MQDRLTKRQETFAQLVAELGSASDAYRRAYPRARTWLAKTVHEQASRLLATRKVSARVAQLRGEAAKEHAITAARIVEELIHTGFLDVADAFDATGRMLAIHAMPEHVRRAIAGVKVKRVASGKDDGVVVQILDLKFNDKHRALRSLGDYLGIWDPASKDRAAQDDLSRMTDDELQAEAERAEAEVRAALAERTTLN